MDYLVFLDFGFAGLTGKADGFKVEEASQEIIEVSWIIANSSSLEIVREKQVFCKCSPGVMQEAVKNGVFTEERVATIEVGLHDALESLNDSIASVILSRNLKSRLVTFGSNSIRVGFLNEAALKGVQIPNFLKRSQIFDLNQEVPKWLPNRIQDMKHNFNLSELAKMLSIDYEEKVTALDNCYIMLKIISSILSSTDSKELFIKLADMSVDYDQFLEEESRAILLTGLPLSISHSELMSWFSEQDLKPVRLLTIQNNSSEVSAGVCQAIFDTHSEAKRALALNLTNYSDRLVEVSPSSQYFSATFHLTPLPTANITEKAIKSIDASSPSYEYKCTNGNGNSSYSNRNSSSAHDSIYPYQSQSSHQQPRSNSRGYSRNHSISAYSPRDSYGSAERYSRSKHPPITKVVPGDWVCPVQNCATYNYSFRLNCYKCNCCKPQSSHYSSGHSSGHRHHSTYQSRHHSSHHSSHHLSHHPSHHSSHRSPYPPPSRSSSHGSRPGDWFCPNRNCGFQNFASRVACLRCGAENPVYKVAPHAAPTPVPLSSTGFRQGDWICPGCSSHNFASRYACMRCSGPRPANGPINHLSSNMNSSSGSQPLLAGDWLCRHDDCGFHNFAKRHVCGRCGAPADL